MHVCQIVLLKLLGGLAATLLKLKSFVVLLFPW